MIINEKFFKQYSPIPINYNMAELKNYISVAQSIWLRPLLGISLMDELEEQVAANTVSEENATLLTEGGVWQYLAYATCLEGLAFIWAHFSETGISLGKSENSDSVTLKDLTYIEANLRRQVEVLKENVRQFICEHHEYYPLADVCSCGCSCCNQGNGKLEYPNPMQQLYSPRRRNTNLR